MKKIIACIILFTALNTIAQTKFEKGYYIDNLGNKEEGLINNENWIYSPKSFLFKSYETSKKKSKNVKNIREFGIFGKIKYVKATVNIDRSSRKVVKLSSVRTSEFKEEKLLLKVLVEGDANLYSYTENDLNRYFYKTKSTKIKPLEYKIYKNSKGSISITEITCTN